MTALRTQLKIAHAHAVLRSANGWARPGGELPGVLPLELGSSYVDVASAGHCKLVSASPRVRLLLLEPEIVSFNPEDIQHGYFDAFFPLELG